MHLAAQHLAAQHLAAQHLAQCGPALSTMRVCRESRNVNNECASRYARIGQN